MSGDGAFNWADGLQHINKLLLEELFDHKKVISVNENFDRTLVERINLEVLTKVVPPFSERVNGYLQDQIKALKDQVAESRDDYERLNKEKVQQEADIESANRNFRLMQETRHEELVRIDEEAEQRKQEEEDTRQSLQKQITKLKQDLLEARRTTGTREGYVDDLHNAYEALQQEIGTTKTELEKVQNELQEARDETRETIENIKDERLGVGETKMQLDKAREELEAHRKRQESLEARTRELEALRTAAEGNAQRLQDLAQQRQRDIDSLQEALKAARGNLEDDEHQQTEYLKKLEQQITEHLKFLKEKVGELREVLGDESKKLDDFFNKAPDQLEAIIRRLRDAREGGEGHADDETSRKLTQDLERLASEKSYSSFTGPSSSGESFPTNDLHAGTKERAKKAERLEAEVKRLTDQLAQSGERHRELVDDFTGQYREMIRHGEIVGAELDQQIRASQESLDQYRERLGRLNREMERNPGDAEAARNRRRVVGMQGEIDRINSIIRTLTDEKTFFDDAVRQLEGARRRAGVAAAPAEPPQPEEGGGGGGGTFWLTAIASLAWNLAQTLLRVVFRGRLNLVLYVGAFLSMTTAALAFGLELASWRYANSPTRRGLYANSVDASTICLKLPTLEVFTSFFAALMAGRWKLVV
ncbi:hypothetical protein GGS23DRAFT_578681 [Durotheca rogersii]|uniref:uncharacterized protein n=1 Tax=Durotheca rogersii TaxID=419775 RepID=UPI00221E94AD|nr:uncharacterized protein GGS23DRAFT_578681 [Durotheca rogersii]KAI5861076.1 hypothetical protein GGS23DRAFT_578681 [Durotheca rogersii]